MMPTKWSTGIAICKHKDNSLHKLALLMDTMYASSSNPSNQPVWRHFWIQSQDLLSHSHNVRNRKIFLHKSSAQQHEAQVASCRRFWSRCRFQLHCFDTFEDIADPLSSFAVDWIVLAPTDHFLCTESPSSVLTCLPTVCIDRTTLC